MVNIIVVESSILSHGHNKRYVVADKDTGELLDYAKQRGVRVIELLDLKNRFVTSTE